MRRFTAVAVAVIVAALASVGAAQILYPNQIIPLTAQLPGGGTVQVLGGVLADLDQDGDDDLIGGGGSTAVCVCKSVGGTLVPGVALPLNPGQIAGKLTIRDLDGDGDRDVVVGTYGATAWLGVMVLLNDGSGGLSFSNPAFIPTPGAGAVTVGLMNADSIPDIIFLTQWAGGSQIFLGTGVAQFAPPIPGPATTTSFVAVYDDDFDGDDDFHEVVAGNLVTYRNYALLFSAAIVRFPVAGNLVRPVFKDIDVDGNVDIALIGGPSGGGGSIQVAIGDGVGGFTPGPIQPMVPTGGLFLGGLADFDGDAAPDLLGTNLDTACYAPNLGNGVFGAPTFFKVSGSSAAACGDFTGDGIADAVYSVSTGVTVQPGVASRGLSHPTAVPIPGGGSTFEITDLNHDGLPDAVVGWGTPILGAPQWINVYLSVDTAPLPTQSFVVGGSPASDIATGDWNRDGNVDVLVSVNQDLQLLLGSASGTLAAPTLIPVGSWTAGLSPADVNLDGNLDVVFVQNGPAITVLFGNGAGNFVAGPSTIVCPNFITPVCFTVPQIAVDDVNQDGFVDVVVTIPGIASVQGSTFAMLGNGSGAFSAVPIAVSLSTAIALGDLNGDHVPDLLLNSVNNPMTLEVRLGSGGGVFGPQASFTGPAIDLMIGDLDGDGDSDVLSGAAVFRLNDGLGGFGQAVSLLCPQATRGAIADFDLDLQNDVAFFQPALGVLSIFHHVPACSAVGYSYGLGCPGSGGFVPRLRASGCPSPGGILNLALDRALGGASTAALVVSPTPMNVQIGSGCGVLVDLAAAFTAPLTVTGPSVAGQGRAGLSVQVPASVPPGMTAAIQAAVLDPGSPFQWSATNGIAIVIQ